MKVTYVFHSGFLVETARCYYLFDYYRGDLPLLAPEKPITVLASHRHADHYDPAVFASLAKAGAKHIFAVLATDIPQKKTPGGLAHMQVRPNESYALPNGETLETLRSTDRGVAFVLTTSEGTIYHAGDLNDWTWEGESDADNRQMRGSYRHEIDKLRDRQLDLAFVPLDPRLESHYADGLLYLLKQANVVRAYPMHYWEQPAIVARFLSEYPQYRGVVTSPEA